MKKYTIHYTNSPIKTANRKLTKKQKLTGFAKNMRLHIGLIALLVIGLVGTQVFLAAKVATSGREVKELEAKEAKIEAEINIIQEKIAQATSIREIETRAQKELKMVKASQQNNIIYIDNTDYPLALR